MRDNHSMDEEAHKHGEPTSRPRCIYDVLSRRCDFGTPRSQSHALALGAHAVGIWKNAVVSTIHTVRLAVGLSMGARLLGGPVQMKLTLLCVPPAYPGSVEPR